MDNETSTKALYAELYKPETHNYGSFGTRSKTELRAESEVSEQGRLIAGYLARFEVPREAAVFEVGCGLAHLNWCHPNWSGLEYSSTAVHLAKQLYGSQLKIVEGDARDMPMPAASVDLIYSFAALEHVPRLELAFAEIERVLKPTGIAILGPAWNCRPWTVKKLQQRPYSELNFSERAGKFLIPVRNSLAYRMAKTLPKRLVREAVSALNRSQHFPLEYRPLQPDLSLLERYPHISDDDAFVDVDAHAALVYFRSRGWHCESHPSTIRRITCRGEEIVVRKPSGCAARFC